MERSMRGHLTTGAALIALLLSVPVWGSVYYVATNGNDNGPGTLAQPFASIAKAQQAASAGDTVYIRGGTYTNFSVAATDANYQYVVAITKSNISYLAYPGDPPPVLDFSSISPASLRIDGMEITGSNNTFEGIQVTGITAGTEKQCENWRVSGSGNTFDQIVNDNDQANGIYIISHASNNLVENCDSYNLVGVSGISAGNTDGFGCHSAGSGNVFYGDRAWGDSDDGYDCINNSGGGVTFNHCWAYDNGRFDGNANGFKVGGFGDSGGPFPDPPSANTVEFCLSADNGANGFYANHQPGQSAYWYNDTAYNDHSDFNMLEAINTSPADASVPGTREIMHNDLAYVGTAISNLNESGSMVSFNSFTLPLTVTASDFLSLDATQMTLPRNPDGSLPNITFMHLAPGSDLINAGVDVGLPFFGSAPDLGAFEVPEPGSAALTFTALAAYAARRRRRTPL
jgi:hypothetical protein